MNKQLPVVIAIVYDAQGSILVGQRGASPLLEVSEKWEYPGGKIDFGEDPEAALIREVKEETGLDVNVIGMVPKIFTHVWDHQEGYKVHVVIIVYKCGITGGSLLENEPDKVKNLKFVNKEELKRLQESMLMPNRYFFDYL